MNKLKATSLDKKKRINANKLASINIKRKNIPYINDTEIERISGFLYLGRWVTNNDDDSEYIDINLKKTRKKLFRIEKRLKRKEANAKVMGTFYKTIIQTLLLYGSETWVINNTYLQEL